MGKKERNRLRRRRKELWEYYNGLCGICHKPIPLEEVTIDHILPKSRGGLMTFENTQPAHADCNVKKADKVPMVSMRDMLEQILSKREGDDTGG